MRRFIVLAAVAIALMAGIVAIKNTRGRWHDRQHASGSGIPVANFVALDPPAEWPRVRVGPFSVQLPISGTPDAKPFGSPPSGLQITTKQATFVVFVATAYTGTDHLARMRVADIPGSLNRDEVALRAFLYAMGDQAPRSMTRDQAERLQGLQKALVARSADRVEVIYGEGLKGLALHSHTRNDENVSYEYYSGDEQCRGVLLMENPTDPGAADLSRRVISSCRFEPSEPTLRVLADPKRVIEDAMANLAASTTSRPLQVGSKNAED